MPEALGHIQVEQLTAPAEYCAYYEVALWYTHNQAHELEQGTPRHTALYSQLETFRALRDSLAYNLPLEVTSQASQYLASAIKAHDYIELYDRKYSTSYWAAALSNLYNYFSIMGGGMRAARFELQRWYAHHIKDYAQFTNLTIHAHAAQTGKVMSYETAMHLTRAAIEHDKAEKEGIVGAWGEAYKHLKLHYTELALLY